jgi:hypothetical protein
MKNLQKIWGGSSMFSLLFAIIFFNSCQKDQSAVEEYRYKKSLSLRPPTTSTSSTTTPSTVAPTIKLVNLLNITTDTTTLQPSVSTGASSYQWTQEVGPVAIISSASSQQTLISSLATGEYRFRLTGTNSVGNSSDTVHVSVKLSSVVSPTTTTTRQNLLFESTFELTNPFRYWYWMDTTASYSITQSTDFARAGTHSARFELHNTDPAIGGGTRTELSLAYDQSQFVERWYGVSIYLPSGYISDPCPEVLWQLHANTSTSPPISIGTLNSKWMLSINYDTGANMATKYQNIPINNWNAGAWTDYVVHVRWDDGSRGNGIVQIWQNGTLIYTSVGKNDFSAALTFNNGGHYLKTGIYKWPYSLGWGCATTQRVVYIDEVRVGSELATYKDVAP